MEEARKNTIRYGIYIYVLIGLFFLLMKLLGLEHVAWLRVFNLLVIVYMSNRLAKLNFSMKHEMEYGSRLASVFLANIIGVVLSVGSFYFYVKLFDPAFMLRFDEGALWIGSFTLHEAVAAFFLEGAAGSIAVSFIVMQYWKDMKSTKNQVPVDKQRASF
jgi:hypothetical protein